jgi:hypothetical protein
LLRFRTHYLHRTIDEEEVDDQQVEKQQKQKKRKG